MTLSRLIAVLRQWSDSLYWNYILGISAQG